MCCWRRMLLYTLEMLGKSGNDMLHLIIFYIAATAEASKSISSRATKIPPAKKAQLLTRFLEKR